MQLPSMKHAYQYSLSVAIGAELKGTSLSINYHHTHNVIIYIIYTNILMFEKKYINIIMYRFIELLGHACKVGVIGRGVTEMNRLRIRHRNLAAELERKQSYRD